MINRAALLSDLKGELSKLEADLLERSESADVPEVGRKLRAEYERAKDAERTAQNYEDWRSDAITQAAAAWVLSCVFTRFLEDNQLIDPARIAGPGDRLQRARDEHELYFRQHPRETDREYLLAIFNELAGLPGAKDLFGEHNPIRELPNWLSGDAAGELLRFLQKIDADNGLLVHDFTDTNWDTRFLGDLYQDLSEAARKKYALLQTPEFVEEFILDRTLDPALDDFGLDTAPVINGNGETSSEAGFRMIDPACGSGHFVLGSFARILNRWQRKEPGTNVRELVQRVLDSVFGVDVNPYAVAIARFRLLLAALRACGVSRLCDAPAFRINLACGDSLLHGPDSTVQQTIGDWAPLHHAYMPEDLPELQRILRPRTYHAVVANPPYITPKDRQLNQAYRSRYDACHKKYSLAVPFMQRLFQLAIQGDGNVRPAGYVGQITANSFMKREFGKKLIEYYLPQIDLTHVVDLAGGGGAHIPGHKTGTVILFGRNRKPVTSTVRTVMGIRGEPSTPVDPSRGFVWKAIVAQIDQPGSQSEFVSVGDTPREFFHKHPWSIGGGGASELKERLESIAETTLDSQIAAIGPFQDTHADEVFVQPMGFAARNRVRYGFRPQIRGDNIRDWAVTSDEEIFFPYLDDLSQWQEIPYEPRWNWLYSLRTDLWARSTFGGGTYRSEGRPWFDYHQFPKDRARTPLSIVFAFVATHNHFVLDRGGKVFNRSSPVIKLPHTASVDDHLALLGLLSSSTACFWMKQVLYPKATSTGDISAEKGKPEANRYEFAGTAIERFPLPFTPGSPDATVVRQIAAKLDALSTRLQAALPESILRNCRHSGIANLKTLLQMGRQTYSVTYARMIALQEELDWENYRCFGLCSDGASEVIVNDDLHGISADARPFVWQAETAPDSVPENWRGTYEARRRLRRTSSELAVIEDPVFKRQWWGRQGVYGRLARDYEGWTAEALVKWLLDRLESYFDFDGRMDDTALPTAKLDIALASVAKLADVARQDSEFQQVGRLYRDDPAFDVLALVAELVAAECVPLLPILRYKPSGLRKRAEWEKTWVLQRREDAGENIGAIPVPPKYETKDFISTGGARYWALRGKLDVPKERWVSFPCCEGPDGTLMIAWAGYDHLQLAKAVSAYYVRVQEDLGGRDDPRLVPLLACLVELLPWLKQWHNEVDPEFQMAMGNYFEGFITEEARSLGKTVEEVKSWTPPTRAATRRGRRAAT